MKYTFRWLKVKCYDDPECDQFVDADAPEVIIFTDEDIALREAERMLNLYNVRDVVAVNIYRDTNILTPIDTIIHKDWTPRK